MSFAGRIWRILVGVKDALVLVFMLFFFGGLYALLSQGPYRGVGEGALLLDISGTIVEQPAERSPLELIAGAPGPFREYRLRDMVHALETAAGDDRVKAVALDLDIFTGGGRVALDRVADALDAVRRSGKPVIAYASGYSDGGYRLAAHASEIWVHPMGGVLIAGPGRSQLYYKGLLDKLGVTANVYQAGIYKSAVEPYTRSGMSPEAREASEDLAGALWRDYLADVRAARPKAQVAAYARNPVEALEAADGDLAKAALAHGLVDRVGDRTAFGRRIAQFAGAEYEDVPGSFETVAYDDWVAAEPIDEDRGRIGVVTIAGTIVDGPAALGTAGSSTIVEALERGLAEHDIEALVVRIDSPGGSALASEHIRRAIIAAKRREIPVIVSMGSVAASGGYWVATAGDHIFAEPSTITGSIGVFGVLPSFEGTLAKIGLNADGVRTTPLSGEPDFLQGISPTADRMIELGTQSTYRRFLALVASSRGIAPARVAEIAEGRVWDGGTARQLGLVDSFGGFDDALAEAARRAGIEPEDAEPVFLEPKPALPSWLFDGAAGSPPAGDIFSRLAASPRQLIDQALADAEQILAGPAIQARCLDCPRELFPTPPREGWLARLLGL
ncbi:MAG: signal peptide peptidase SppA [Sphingomonadaceae bacterium]